MILIPAVDLLGGKVVRLFQGDMDNYIVYSDDPVDIAKKFIDMGVERLHIVDLDGARAGGTSNYGTIENIAFLGGLKLEAGGGIRSMDAVSRYLSIGIDYVILGTVVAKDPELTKEALSAYPGSIILGIDALGGMVATEGWYESSNIQIAELIDIYKDYSAESVIYTDIEKDGTLTGLNLDTTMRVAGASPFPVIASGGVSTAADIDMLLDLEHPNIKGCIIGKAIYEGRIDLKAELEKVRLHG